MGVSFGPSGLSTTLDAFDYPTVAYSGLPVSAAVGEVYEITDFGIPYVQVQWNGSAWVQKTDFHCAWAALPSATTFNGFSGFVEDYFNSFRIRAIGGNWHPYYPLRMLNYQTPSTVFGPNNPVVEHTLVGCTLVPDGLIHLGDVFLLDSFVIRGGTLVTGGGRINVRLGTNSTTPTSNSVLVYTSFTGTSNTSQRSWARGTVLTATTCQQQLTTGIGLAVSTVAPTDNTIPNIATSGLYISLSVVAAGVLETAIPYSITLTHEPSGIL